MLQKLSEGIKGWVATVIVVIIAISFVVFGISYYLNSHSGASAVIAKVGSASITNTELHQILRREQFMRERTQGALSKEELNFLKLQIFDALIQRAQKEQALNKLGLEVSKQAIEQTVQTLPAFQQGGNYSPELLKARLANSGMSLQQFMQQVSYQLTYQQLNLGISLSIAVSNDAIMALHNWAEQTRSFRYIQVSPKVFLSQIKVTKKELQAYYQSHLKSYQLPDRVVLNYIDLNPKDLVKNTTVSSTQLRQYYQANKAQFRLPATYRYANVVVLKSEASKDAATEQKEINAISAALKSGKSLQSIVSKFGGSVRSTTADKLNPQILGLLQTMRPGQTTPATQVPVGTLWLQLILVKPGAVKPFALVEQQIKAMLLAQKVTAKMAPMTEKLSDLTYTQSDSLQPAANALGLVIKQSGFVTKSGNNKGLFADKKLLKAAFSDEVLKQGNNSMPITLSDGSVVVLRVKTFKKAQTQPLAAVKAQVIDHVKQQSAQLQAALYAAKLQQVLKAHQPVAKMLSAKRLSWKSVQAVKRDNKKVPAPILRAAFSYKTAPTVATVADGGSTAIVGLQAISLPKTKPSMTQRPALARSIRSFYAGLEVATLLQSVENSIPVKRYAKRIS